MRRSIVVGVVIVGLASLASARQHPVVAPSAARPMPAAPVGHAAPMRAPYAAHPGTHPVSSGTTPSLPHKSNSHSGNLQTNGSLDGNNGNAGNRIRNNYCSGQPFSNSSGNPVPGFGFDYEHFFAVHPSWNTCHQVSGVVVPFFGGGGFYMPVPYYSESGGQEGNQENAANDQQESGRQISAQEASSSSASSRQSSYNYSPVEPVAEFVFVKRDGSTFNAVAYTLLKDKIRYVTKDGLRRTVPLDSLDLAATQKTNEERGTTIEFPGLSHA